MVDLLVIDFLNAIGAEGLHASGAWHGCGRDDFSLSTFEKGAEVDLSMQHEFLASLAIDPEICRRVETWS